MKYLVELKYTNPAHEHVSLRRRVETVTRLIEAANEDQAILRVSQQQRALGFFIKEAKVVKEKSHDKEGGDETVVAKGKDVMKKAKGKDEKDEVEAEDVEEIDEAQKKLRPSYWKAEWRLGTQTDVDKNNKKIYDRLAQTDPDKAKAFHDNLMRMKKKDVKEEVEQIDELKKSTLASYVKKATRDVASASRLQRGYETDAARKGDAANYVARGSDLAAKTMRKFAAKRSRGIAKAVDKLAKEEVEQVNEKINLVTAKMGDVIKDFQKSDAPQFKGKSQEERRKMALAAKLGAEREAGMREEVDTDKRDAGYKMSPAVRAAQAKSDALSKPEKKHQAGTLGAHKARKAAERMVDAAKSKVNKINMNPSLEPHAHSLKLNK